MSEANSFADFLAGLRAKDDAVTKRFVQVYSPIILGVIDRRLSQLGLSSVLDPEDIVQEVFARFFAQAVQQSDLASWDDLVRLLTTMTLNVLRSEYRRAHRIRRGGGKQAKVPADLEAILALGGEPSGDLQIEDEIEQIKKLLSEQEWNLAWARASGKTWEEIAAESGQKADTLLHGATAADRSYQNSPPRRTTTRGLRATGSMPAGWASAHRRDQPGGSLHATANGANLYTIARRRSRHRKAATTARGTRNWSRLFHVYTGAIGKARPMRTWP
jgi:DNA-directed RNA polymerase specialized sigma24 family protein